MTEMFLPAWKGGDVLWDSKDRMPWWTPSAPKGLYYPHLLASYAHWRDHEFSFPKGTFILGDSGGFNVRTKGEVFDPVRVLGWQSRRGCAAGLILDIPPVSETEGKYDLDDALKRTVQNVRRARPRYEMLRRAGDPMRWWGVVHGRVKSKEMDRWYDMIAQVYPFTDDQEGWAVRVEPSITPLTVAWTMGMFARRKTRRVHFLKTTAPKQTAVLFALAPLCPVLEWWSVDSTSHLVAAGNRRRFEVKEGGLGYSIEVGLSDECPCDACRYYAKVGRPWYRPLTTAHNLRVQLEVFDRQRKLVAKDPEATLKVLGVSWKHVLREFEAGREGAVSTLSTGGGLLDYV